MKKRVITVQGAATLTLKGMAAIRQAVRNDWVQSTFISLDMRESKMLVDLDSLCKRFRLDQTESRTAFLIRAMADMAVVMKCPDGTELEVLHNVPLIPDHTRTPVHRPPTAGDNR